MSRAFISEEAEEARAALLPERPVSAHANLVTPHGLELIEIQLASLQSTLAASPADDAMRPRLQRDLRYWQLRRTSAQVVEQRQVAPEEVVFGTLVVLRRGSTKQRFRLVGEDEADPAHELLSWTSPLAKALMSARPGETVDMGDDREPVTIEAIEP